MENYQKLFQDKCSYQYYIKHPKKSFAALVQVAQSGPDELRFEACNILGQIYFHKDYEKSKQYFLKALEINPSDTYCYPYLGVLLLQEGDLHGIDYLCKDVKQSGGTNSTTLKLLYMARKWYTRKWEKEALAYLETELEKLWNTNDLIKGYMCLYDIVPRSVEPDVFPDGKPDEGNSDSERFANCRADLYLDYMKAHYGHLPNTAEIMSRSVNLARYEKDAKQIRGDIFDACNSFGSQWCNVTLPEGSQQQSGNTKSGIMPIVLIIGIGILIAIVWFVIK